MNLDMLELSIDFKLDMIIPDTVRYNEESVVFLQLRPKVHMSILNFFAYFLHKIIAFNEFGIIIFFKIFRYSIFVHFRQII